MTDQAGSNLSIPRPRFTRSKEGCLTCRQRKIKCDETHPVCKECSCRGRSCEWPTAEQLVRPRRRRPPPDSSVTTSQADNPLDTATSAPFLEPAQQAPPRLDMDTPDLVARFKRQLVEQGLMKEEEEFEHVNAVESYTSEEMSTIMHSAQGEEREFYASLLSDMEVDVEGNKQMVEQRGVAQQDMEVDENVGESQQTSSSKDWGEGTPTPRQASLPLPKPSLQPLPSGKRSLSPEEERDVAAEHNAKKVRLDTPRLDTPPASNTQNTQTSEDANTGIELNDSLEDDLHFEDDEVDDVSISIGPQGSGTKLSSQERLRVRVLVQQTRRVFLPQSPGRRKGPSNHTPGGILTPTTYAPGPAQTIVEPGPQIAGQTNEEDEPAYQVLEGDLLLEISPMDRDRPRELIKAQRYVPHSPPRLSTSIMRQL